MHKEKKDILEFGQFRLDRGEALLTRLGTPVPLPPKVFDLLSYLVLNAGRLVEKEELLKALWPDSFVEEANLTVNIAALRRALGSQPDAQPWIETVPKRGYRFLAIVARSAETPVDQTRVTELSPEPPPVVSPVWARGKYLVAVAALALVVFVVYMYVNWKQGRQVTPQRPERDPLGGDDEVRHIRGLGDRAIVAQLRCSLHLCGPHRLPRLRVAIRA